VQHVSANAGARDPGLTCVQHGAASPPTPARADSRLRHAVGCFGALLSHFSRVKSLALQARRCGTARGSGTAATGRAR